MDRRSGMRIQIGEAAPNFTADAFYGGTVQEITLSQYRGQWVVLFFYVADFTFV